MKENQWFWEALIIRGAISEGMLGWGPGWQPPWLSDHQFQIRGEDFSGLVHGMSTDNATSREVCFQSRECRFGKTNCPHFSCKKGCRWVCIFEFFFHWFWCLNGKLVVWLASLGFLFGILGYPLTGNSFQEAIPGIQDTKLNRRTGMTITWIRTNYCKI